MKVVIGIMILHQMLPVIYLLYLNSNLFSLLNVVSSVLQYARPLTVELQKRDIDIASAFQMVQLLRTTLNDIRNNIDRHHNIWYMEACTMGRSVGTIANKSRISSTRSY